MLELRSRIPNISDSGITTEWLHGELVSPLNRTHVARHTECIIQIACQLASIQQITSYPFNGNLFPPYILSYINIHLVAVTWKHACNMTTIAICSVCNLLVLHDWSCNWSRNLTSKRFCLLILQDDLASSAARGWEHYRWTFIPPITPQDPTGWSYTAHLHHN